MQASLKAASSLLCSAQWLHTKIPSNFEETLRKLFSQTKYKEATEFILNNPEIGRTPEVLAMYKRIPLEAGRTSSLLYYFGSMLNRGKLKGFESVELSKIIINQHQKELLAYLVDTDKLECSDELGDVAMSYDKNLALEIYEKARLTTKGVSALCKRREYNAIQDQAKKVEKIPDYAFLDEVIFKSEPDVNLKSLAIILWDIDNCKIPRNYASENVHHRISVALREWLGVKGLIKQFRAYGDVINMSQKLRQGYHDNGVLCIHAPGKVAIETMIRDMMDFTRLHPPPATIVIISGDGGFASTRCYLKQLGYTVASILPDKNMSEELNSSAKDTLHFRDLLSGHVTSDAEGKNKGHILHLADDLRKLVQKHGGRILLSELPSVCKPFYKEEIEFLNSKEKLATFVDMYLNGILELSANCIRLATRQEPQDVQKQGLFKAEAEEIIDF